MDNKHSKVRTVRKRPKQFNKGGTDINPMWRIKTLTEQFGLRHRVTLRENGQVDGTGTGAPYAFMSINLYVKVRNGASPWWGSGNMLLDVQKV